VRKEKMTMKNPVPSFSQLWAVAAAGLWLPALGGLHGADSGPSIPCPAASTCPQFPMPATSDSVPGHHPL
jgi:hypothetical protein